MASLLGCRENYCIERSKDTNLYCPSNSHWSDKHFKSINNITDVCARTPLQASAGLKQKLRKRRQPKRKHRQNKNFQKWLKKLTNLAKNGGFFGR